MVVLGPRREHSTALALLLAIAILAAGLPEMAGSAVPGSTPGFLTLNICNPGGTGRAAPAHEIGPLPALLPVSTIFFTTTLALTLIASHSRSPQAPQPPPPKTRA